MPVEVRDGGMGDAATKTNFNHRYSGVSDFYISNRIITDREAWHPPKNGYT